MVQSIAIIGAGVIGSSTCYAITRHPDFASRCSSLTLIEGSSIGDSASGKAGGLLALDWHGSTTASLAELSYRTHRRLADEHDGRNRWGYRQLETLSINAKVGKARQKQALPSKTTNPEHQWLDPHVLSSQPGVLGTHDTTSQVHPYLLTTSLASLAQEQGAKIVHATVTSLEKMPGSPPLFRLKLDDGGHVDAHKVVICAGPWTGRLAKQLGNLDLGRANDITGSRAHSIVLEPTSGKLPAQALFTSIKEGGSFSEPEIYNRPDNTAYCCGPTDNSRLPERAADVQVDEAAIGALLKNVSHLSPLLRDATVRRRQACYLPVGSGDPVIGETKERGLYVAAGHSCWGICNGPGTGVVMAELLLEGRARSANISHLTP